MRAGWAGGVGEKNFSANAACERPAQLDKCTFRSLRGAQLDKHVFGNSQRVACNALPPGSDSLGWKSLGRQLGQHEDTLGLRDFVSRTAYVCCKPSPPSDADLQLGICKS